MRKLLLLLASIVSVGIYGQNLTLSGTDIEDTYAVTSSLVNYGSNTRLKVATWSGLKYTSYIQFDLSAIPANATITSATLTLKDNTSGSGIDSNTGVNSVNINKVTSAWAEGTMNGNNQPSFTLPGGIYVSSNSSQNETLNIDITSYVQSWYASPSTNHGIRMYSKATSNAARNFASSEHADGPVVSIDYTLPAGPIDSYPYEESWETLDYEWTQEGSGSYDWARDANGTPSGSTGPGSANDGTYYMYVESSSPNYPSKEFLFQSPEFDLGSTPREIMFDYHMYGSNMGTLELQISTDETNWTNLWSLSGDQGNQWSSATISLASYTNQNVFFRFRGVTGSSYRGDMAIDKVTVRDLGIYPPTIGDNVSLTEPGNTTLSVGAVTGVDGYAWYDAATGGNKVYESSTTSFTTPHLEMTTTYHVASTLGNIESQSRYAISVLIQPEIQVDGVPMLKTGGSVTLMGTPGYDEYEWKNSSNVTVGTSVNFSVTTPGVYTLEAEQNGHVTVSTPMTVSSTLNTGSQDVNFVESYTVRVPGVTSTADLDNMVIGEMTHQAQYMDGLGRAYQTVSTMSSPNFNDMVTPVEYDDFGRVEKEFLPYAASPTTPGSVRTDAVTDQASFSIYQGETSYAQKIYENSPLSRVIEQAAPGNDWNVASGNTVTMDYALNGTDEVILWDMGTGTTPTPNGYYGTGQLFKNTTTDEEGNESITYTDKEGRTLVKKLKVDATEWAETHYIYDEMGRLRVVLPPMAIDALDGSNNLTGNTLDDFGFQYKYDHRNRMIEKKVPGADWVYMVYDQWDRLVLTQDGVQRTSNNWLFTKYDQLNRPIINGLITDASGTLKASVEAGTVRFETRNNLSAEGYTNNSLPSHAATNNFTVTYYDDYSFLDIAGDWEPNDNPGHQFVQDVNQDLEETIDGHLYAFPSTEQEYVTGQVTGTKTKNLKQNSWIRTITFYDDRGRVIQTTTDNIRGGYDRASNLYDFSGQLLSTKTAHYETPTAEPELILRRFEYDHMGRRVRAYHNIATTLGFESNNEVLIAENTYDELSRLEEKNLHGHEAHKTQSLDFSYNLRGWMTGINDSQLSDGENDLFGMELYYHNNPIDGTKEFHNGNIGGMEWSDWSATSGNQTRTYAFSYDRLNRLESAAANGNLNNAFSVLNLDYDLNGNIKALKRRGDTNGGLIDDLIYKYMEGNKLELVHDLEDNVEGFDRGTTTATEQDYYYDENGNLTEDRNKEIDDIQYNHLNLPSKLELRDAGDSILYFYDAAGIKLRQEVYKAGVLETERDYVGEFFYENDTLRFLQHEEGRIVYNPEQTDVWDYQYHLKDHLGNTRVTYSTTDEKYTNTETFETGEDNGFKDLHRFTNVNANTTSGGNEVERLQSGQEGALLMLEVNKGDTIRISVNANYETPPTGTTFLETAFNVLFNTFDGAYGSTSGESNPIIGDPNEFNDALSGTGMGQKTDATNAPRAYINYIYFDTAMNYHTAGFTQISTAADGIGVHELVKIEDIVADKNGFILAYLTNENQQAVDVFFDDFTIEHTKTPVVQTDDYYPFGLTYNSFTRNYGEPQLYKFNGKEQQEGSDWFDFGARMYMADIGRWMIVDPKAEYMRRHSVYNFAFDNPIRYIDPDGMRPWPVNKFFGKAKRWVASWFGPRNVKNNPKATKNHKGLDINMGGGYDDYGAPVYATHEGVVHEVKTSTSGNGGRRVVIKAPDGSFRTSYFHLKAINVEEGDEVKEGEQIGEIGASAFGKEKGTASHLHYAIEKKDEFGVFKWYNPTQGLGNEEKNIVDPQKWIKDSGVSKSKKRVRDMGGKVVGKATVYTNTGNNASGWRKFVKDLLNNLTNPSGYTGKDKK